MSITRYILPFLLVILSGLMFVLYINPTYKSILLLQSKKVDFTDAISKAGEVRELQAKLLAEVEAIDSTDRARLEKILPPSYDTVLVLYELNTFAQKRGLSLKSPAVKLQTIDANKATIAQPQVTTMSVEFTVSAPYAIFRGFIADLERELSVRDIKSLSIAGGGEGGGVVESSVFTYQIKIEGYAYQEKEKPTRVPRTTTP